MTTIAYKAGILAADTQMTDDTIKVPIRKLILVDDGEGCVAFCGDVARVHAFLAWFETGAPPETCRKRLYKDVGFIYVDPEGDAFWYDNSPYPVPIDAPFYAMGTGHVLATGAMKSGLSAPEAVKFAGSLDIYTNQDVEYYNVRTKKIKKYTS